jgi:diguanylate cyclase (GGDEF)-like protein/PAS domain S-box-containing protein
MDSLLPAQHEEIRLASLHATGILDTPPEERFDRITRLAQRIFCVPIALVSLVDRNRQWFKARCGLSETEMPRAIAFCDHAIRQETMLVVPDACNDLRFLNNPLVTGEPGIRFYAGQVLKSPDGHAIGTLCIIDVRPREITAEDQACLRDLAGLVEAQIAGTALARASVQSQHALRQANDAFRATFEQAAVGIAHVALDGTFLRVNQALCDLLSYSADELMATTFQRITFPPDLEKDLAMTEPLLSGQQRSFAMEKRYITRDGALIWINLTVSLLRHSDGLPHYFVSVVEDIQEKKLAELALQRLNADLEERIAERTCALEESNRSLQVEVERRMRSEMRLKASEEHFRTIIESANDAFVATDACGTITGWNHTAERLFGWRREEAIGKRMTSTLIPLKLQAAFEQGMRDILTTGDSPYLNRQLEMRARTKTGTEVPVEMMLTAYRIDGALLFGAFIRDITERRQTARKMEEKERLLDAVLDTIDVGVVACDADGRLTVFNRAARDFHGLGPRDLTPDKWALEYRLYQPDGRTRLRTGDIPLVRAMNGETVHDQEMVIASDSRPARVLLASGKAMADSGGKKLGAVVAMKDISAVKQSERRSAESELRLRAITENLPVMIAQVDREGNFVYINERGARHYGSTSENLTGKPVSHAHERRPAEFETVRPYMERAMAGERVSFEGEMQLQSTMAHYHATYLPRLDAAGHPDGFYAIGIDITARKNSELSQAESEARLRTIADNLPVYIAYVDSDLVYRFANATYHDWVGISPDEMIGKPVVQVIGTDAFEERKGYFLECLAGREVRFDIDMNINGDTRSLQSAYIPQMHDGRVAGIYILSTDITTLKQQERQLQLQARADSLTGLPNRRAFEERFGDALARISRTGASLALLYLDVDHFKAINDTFGHAAGDLVLKEFAQRLRMATRSTDTVARLGGDEFTVILEGVGGQEEAAGVAQKILEAIARPFIVEDRMHAVSTSIGVAFTGSGGIGMEALSLKADEALYEVKRGGRGHYHVIVAHS